MLKLFSEGEKLDRTVSAKKLLFLGRKEIKTPSYEIETLETTTKGISKQGGSHTSLPIVDDNWESIPCNNSRLIDYSCG